MNLTYVESLNQILKKVLQRDKRVYLIGQGVKSPWYCGNSIKDLDKMFPDRVIDTPVSENAMAGVAIGSALAGMHPILCFPRMDFMYYAFDQIANHMANWNYMFGREKELPILIWAIINRGGEQAAQHAQSIHAMLCHIPNLLVVAPSNPSDVKNLLNLVLEARKPTVFIDDRWLYHKIDHNLRQQAHAKNSKALKLRVGKDVTIVASSYMVHLAMEASEKLGNEGIECEVIDLRVLKPLDIGTVIQSVKKTGKLVVLDGGWQFCGYSAEIITEVAEKALSYFKSPPLRISLPDCPAPASSALEKVYYPSVDSIIVRIKGIVN